MPRQIAMLAAVVLFAPAVAQAAPPLVPPPASPYAECEAAIAGMEKSPARPPDKLLPAIARVESGRLDPVTSRVRPWPWTINVEGTGAFFQTKAEAVAAVQGLQARGIRSIDVGCMQVNLLHHPNAFHGLEQAFDPAENARYATGFLSALFRQTGSWGLATAWYHSQDPERGEDYQRRVFGRVMAPMGAATGAATGAPARVVAATWPPPGVLYAAIPPQNVTFGAFAAARPVVTAFSQSAFSQSAFSPGAYAPSPALRQRVGRR